MFPVFQFDAAFQKSIDEFYFNEIVPRMHPSLQALAVDARVLRHHKEPRTITSFSDIYAPDYLVLPWVLDDIFPVPEAERKIASQAYLMMFVGYILLDHLIDRQVPDVAVVPLVHQHIALGGH